MIMPMAKEIAVTKDQMNYFDCPSQASYSMDC